MSEVKETGEGFNIQELISFCRKKSSARGGFSDYFGNPEDFRTSGSNVLDFVIKRELEKEDGEDDRDFERTKKLNFIRNGNNFRSVSNTGLTEKEKITSEELDDVLALRKYTKSHEGTALFVFYSAQGIFFASPSLYPLDSIESINAVLAAGEGCTKIERYDWGTEAEPTILKDDGFGDIGDDTVCALDDIL